MHDSYIFSWAWRWPAAAALSATAAIHMTLVPDHLREAPYAGALFIALSAAALVTAMLLSAVDHDLVWLAAVAISLGALVAYFLSRSIGLPSLRDDIGDWGNPLGLAAVACEALTVVSWIARSAGLARVFRPVTPRPR
jgi:hypothetical protein